jgi:hypothetical protein
MTPTRSNVARTAAFAGLLCLRAAIARADPPAGEVWDLLCPTGPHACVLRHKAASLHAGGVSVALEVHARGGALVPVVVVQGLSAQAALTASLAGHLSVGLRFDHGPWMELTCEGAIICAPAAGDIPSAAAALPAARSVTLRLDLEVQGVRGIPHPERTLDLSGTVAALVRLRRAGAREEAVPAEPGLDLPGLMNKLMGGG